MSFSVGDVVRLKSGSPKMTVIRNLGKERIICTWFVNNTHPEQREFPALSLELYIGHESHEKPSEEMQLWD